MQCNFLERMLKYFLELKKKDFAHKKLQKPPSKVAQNSSNPLFFLTALTAQTEEVMFQNVAYRAPVYRTGAKVNTSRKSRFLSISC